MGFATTNTPAGKEELVPILVRAYLTSDEREFHIYMEQISNIVMEKAKEVGVILSVVTHLSVRVGYTPAARVNCVWRRHQRER